MSRYIQIDAEEPAFVASNAGWSDFMRWADEAKAAPQLKQLMDEGTCDDPAACADEIEQHTDDVPPSDDNAGIAETLIEHLTGLPDGADISITS